MVIVAWISLDNTINDSFQHITTDWDEATRYGNDHIIFISFLSNTYKDHLELQLASNLREIQAMFLQPVFLFKTL